MVLPDQNKCIDPFDPLSNVNDEDGHKEVRSQVSKERENVFICITERVI